MSVHRYTDRAMCAKKILRQDIIGQQGINLIEREVLGMGFLWHPTNLDAGIDGIIEIRDSTTESRSRARDVGCLAQVARAIVRQGVNASNDFTAPFGWIAYFH